MTTWTLGSATITRIEEQLGFTDLACEAYFPNFERDVLQRELPWVAPQHYSIERDRLVTSIHSWLVRMDNLTILIDSCCGNDKQRSWAPRFHQLKSPYLERLRAAGVTPDAVDLVLCTHLHADHTGWNTMLRDGRWVPTFPNAKYLFSRIDDAYWSAAARAGHPQHAAYQDSVLPVVQSGQAVLVDDGHEVTRRLSVVAAPGHSPGHVMFRLGEENAQAVFCGDVIHHALQIRAPHWYHFADETPADAIASRKRLLESCVDRGTLLFPVHFGAPHVARVVRDGQGFRGEFVAGR
jgi:glyoxylase-like metal-dependent hydrolase (beta-lactamase superfamily II)